MDVNEPIVVYVSINPAEAEVVRMALEAQGIVSKTTGTNQGGLIGTLPEITVVVHASDADRARKIIEKAGHRPHPSV